MGNQNIPEIPQTSEIPEEVKKKHREIQEKLDKLKRKILRSYKKDIIRSVSFGTFRRWESDTLFYSCFRYCERYYSGHGVQRCSQ